MNKISLLVLLFITLCFSVEARPLHLVSKVSKLLSILGRATYYDVSVGYGSCGQLNGNDKLVVAVNHAQMNNGVNPNHNPLCNKKVKVIGKRGAPVVATIVDTCPGCDHGCLDMSPSLFEQVCGNLSMGVCQISWDFV